MIFGLEVTGVDWSAGQGGCLMRGSRSGGDTMHELDRKLIHHGAREARRRGVTTVEAIAEYLQRNPSIKKLYQRKENP